MTRRGLALACLALELALAGCGSMNQASGSVQAARPAARARRTTATEPGRSAARVAHRARATIPAGNWPQFNFTAQRTGVGPSDTGITAGDLSQLRLRAVKLPGTADSSAIELHGIRIHGRARDVLVLTTSYGHTVAIDAATGQTLWEFTPSDIASYDGAAQFTTATPTADPVYGIGSGVT